MQWDTSRYGLRSHHMAHCRSVPPGQPLPVPPHCLGLIHKARALTGARASASGGPSLATSGSATPGGGPVVTGKDDGFMLGRHRYRSLKAVAKAITGKHWNGYLFFGLSARRRRTGSDEVDSRVVPPQLDQP
jgi:hypothetical protein